MEQRLLMKNCNQMIIKFKTTIFLIFIGIVLLNSNVFGQKKIEIFPSNNNDTTELLIGKNINYLLLNSTGQIILDLDDKTERLAVFSRAILNENNEITFYSFSYKIDNGKLKTVKIKNVKIAKYAKVVNPSQYTKISTVRKTLIDIPKSAKKMIIENQRNPILFHFRQEIKGAKKWKDMASVDSTQNNVRIVVGKPFKYFQLSENKPTILNVSGPGKLFIYSRLRLPVEENQNLPEGLMVKLDDKTVKFKKIKNKFPATNALYLNLENRPSKVNKFLITIPPEKHQIKIYSKNITSAIDAHFKYLQEKPVVWVDFTIHQNDTVILQTINNFKKRKYYRTENNHPITFTVTGPLKLRVLVRGEFQYFMHGENEFKFQIFEDDKNKNTYKFSAQRSKKLEYKYNKDLIPGTLQKFYVDVPKGKHLYKFQLPQNYNKTILFRFSFDRNGIIN